MSRLTNVIRKIKTLEENIPTINDTKKLVIYNKNKKKTHRAMKI